MSNVFTLDSMREELDNEFAPVKITLADGSEAVLGNLIRFPQKKRREVAELLDKIKPESDEGAPEKTDEEKEADDLEVLIHVEEIIKLVTEEDKGAQLLSEVADDTGLLMRILEIWLEATKPGEATTSPA